MAKRFFGLCVSTHSRLKAAGTIVAGLAEDAASFNTQPPEGGWAARWRIIFKRGCFNTQPPEGGWDQCLQVGALLSVSTHSRLKAAGKYNLTT